MQFTQNIRARREAQEVLKPYNVKLPEHIDLFAIAGNLQVGIRETTLDGCDARLYINPSKKSAVATINAQIPEIGRKKFGLAHELGHFCLHKNISDEWKCTDIDFLKWQDSKIYEPEANTFAAELIMPEIVFRPLCNGRRPNFGCISELSNAFGTTLTSTTIRFIDFASFPCCLLLSKDSKVRWFWKSQDFQFDVLSPDSQVNPYTCAGDFFCNAIVPSGKSEEIDPTYWINDIRAEHSVKFYECAQSLNRYNIVLSIIWYD
jgi:Zn-dependent peptidase ImmA (M78 family)